METKLFSPWTLKGVTLKNRIVMSPMCMYSSYDRDGKLQPFHFTHYISRAQGQAGLIMVEASAVSPREELVIKTSAFGVMSTLKASLH